MFFNGSTSWSEYEHRVRYIINQSSYNMIFYDILGWLYLKILERKCKSSSSFFNSHQSCQFDAFWKKEERLKNKDIIPKKNPLEFRRWGCKFPIGRLSQKHQGVNRPIQLHKISKKNTSEYSWEWTSCEKEFTEVS